MTTPTRPATYPPSASRVGLAWARRALPDVPAGRRLPSALSTITDTMRVLGYLQVAGNGGRVHAETGMRFSVVTFSCWVPPAEEGSTDVQENAAEWLATRVINATLDGTAWGRIDFASLGLGTYRQAIIRSVLALSDPRDVPPDPDHYARFDVDVEIDWIGV